MRIVTVSLLALFLTSACKSRRSADIKNDDSAVVKKEVQSECAKIPDGNEVKIYSCASKPDSDIESETFVLHDDEEEAAPLALDGPPSFSGILTWLGSPSGDSSDSEYLKCTCEASRSNDHPPGYKTLGSLKLTKAYRNDELREPVAKCFDDSWNALKTLVRNGKSSLGLPKDPNFDAAMETAFCTTKQQNCRKISEREGWKCRPRGSKRDYEDSISISQIMITKSPGFMQFN